jgi:long-chain acyl-CoA synthetase
MNVTLGARGLLTLLPRFDPRRALELIERDRATSFAGVPTMYTALLHHPDREEFDLSSLDLCVSGGSALPVEVLRGFDEAFGAKVLEGYGLSETSPVASFSPFDAEPRVGSIGIPIPGVEMKLLEPGTWDEVNADNSDPDAIGEIAIKGHNIMKGYYGRPDATDEAIQDGWFRSGDLGRRDEDGWYYIVDRSKDMIIRGGYNVYPREIEEVLMTHPDVSLAAVIGIRTRATARRSRPSSSAPRAPRSPRRSSWPGARSRWRRSSTRGPWSSSTRCR